MLVGIVGLLLVGGSAPAMAVESGPALNVYCPLPGPLVRLCFHDFSTALPLARAPANEIHVVKLIVDKYVRDTPASGVAGELIFPCPHVMVDAADSNLCPALGDFKENFLTVPFITNARTGSPEIVAYLVAAKADVLVDGFGIVNEDVNVLCADPTCTRPFAIDGF